LSVVLEPMRCTHDDDGCARPVLAWRLPADTVAIASAVLGGGIRSCAWIVNAQVGIDYCGADPAAHVAAIARSLELKGEQGIGLLTAAPVLDVAVADDHGAECAATVGVSTPTWAAAADGAWSSWTPGTINLVCWVPAPLSLAAMVNAVITATEAKTQALAEAGVPGTGTASDAIAVCCPAGDVEPYGGPRSRWGARLARAVHASVSAGLA
jgi:adenosylcobinamide hydrolase